MQPIPIGLTPFQHEGKLNGILISGRWPESTLEWTQTLVGSVRIACRPGFLPTTTIFGVLEQRPAQGGENTVGMMVAIGNVIDDSFVEAGRFLNIHRRWSCCTRRRRHVRHFRNARRSRPAASCCPDSLNSDSSIEPGGRRRRPTGRS